MSPGYNVLRSLFFKRALVYCARRRCLLSFCVCVWAGMSVFTRFNFLLQADVLNWVQQHFQARIYTGTSINDFNRFNQTYLLWVLSCCSPVGGFRLVNKISESLNCLWSDCPQLAWAPVRKVIISTKQDSTVISVWGHHFDGYLVIILYNITIF